MHESKALPRHSPVVRMDCLDEGCETENTRPPNYSAFVLPQGCNEAYIKPFPTNKHWFSGATLCIPPTHSLPLVFPEKQSPYVWKHLERGRSTTSHTHGIWSTPSQHLHHEVWGAGLDFWLQQSVCLRLHVVRWTNEGDAQRRPNKSDINRLAEKGHARMGVIP